MTLKAWWRRAWHFDRPQVLSAQMLPLHRNLPYANLIAILIAWLTAAAMHVFTETRWAWPWVLGTTGVMAGCLLLLRRLPNPADLTRVHVYARAIRGIAVATGLCWGAMGVLFVDPGQPHSITIVLVMIAGMNSAAVAVYASCWPLALLYTAANVVPVGLSLLLSGDTMVMMLGVAVLLYFYAMAVFAFHVSQSVLRAIELGFENEGLVERLRDQTQRALEARELAEEALCEAEEANRAKTVFLASASHDLRQPLHAMGLFLSALARADLNDRQQRLLMQAQASALATGDMLATLMDFSKVDAGVIRPQVQPFAVQPLFQKLERELAPLAEEKGLAFRMRDTSLVLHADPSLVELILRNLLLNAIRYTERGVVLLACRRRGLRAMVEVWDTGIGIAAEQHQAIFKEFHQLGNPERDRRKGLGLGLAIVQGLARAMSVDVSLQSKPGRGSVFKLALPVSLQPWHEQSIQGLDEPELSGLRVLLIDDDETVRAAMSDLLATWGCWCEAVASGEDAVRILERFEPDVLLADYRLRSHRTGLEAVHTVRAHMGREVPAAIITGDTAAERLREADASGLTLMHKPVPADRLQSVLFSLWRETPASQPGEPESAAS
jgi:signal transduction histidine kinase/ActR/RegA family two-component response regulator